MSREQKTISIIFLQKKNLQRDDITSKMADYVFHAQLKCLLTASGWHVLRIIVPIHKRHISNKRNSTHIDLNLNTCLYGIGKI